MTAVDGRADAAGVVSAAPRRPRLAVSGASSTGKSTLARALSERLAVPYLEEGMRRRLEGGLDLHSLTHAAHRELTGELLDEMLDGMRTARDAHGGHVCDRSPIDMCAFWLYYNFAFDEAATEVFMQRADAALADLDLVVVLPREGLALVDDGVRSANPWVQLHFDALLQAMLARAGDEVAVLHMPPSCRSLEERIAAVLAALAQQGPARRRASDGPA